MQDFNNFVDELMKREGIATDAELARLASIPSSVISRWRSGQMQPSRDNLRKLAAPLNVPPVLLWISAGLAKAEEMDLSGQVDLTVLPTELDDLIALYRDERATDDDRAYLRRSVTGLINNVRADIASREVPPPKRGRRSVA